MPHWHSIPLARKGGLGPVPAATICAGAESNTDNSSMKCMNRVTTNPCLCGLPK
jgi:hypothetical protein